MKSCFIETLPIRYLDRLRRARDEMIRNLFEIPTERERREHAERIARAVRTIYIAACKFSHPTGSSNAIDDQGKPLAAE
jgi:hypothetical protein